MKQSIEQVLDKIEVEKGIRILHAVEGGARAYGLARADSDYDVRFIYVQPLGSYMNMWHSKDTIQVDTYQGLDIHGWDLQKALRLAERSNPNLIEWLNSSIIYRTGEFAWELRDMVSANFTQTRLYNHYVTLMRRTMHKNQLGVPPQNVKEIMRAFRAGLCAEYVRINRSVPPIKFDALLRSFKFYPILLREVEEFVALLKRDMVDMKHPTHTAEHTLKFIRDLAGKDPYTLDLEWDRKPSRSELQKLFNHEVLHG